MLLLAVAPLTPRLFPFREAKSHPVSTFRDRHRSRNYHTTGSQGRGPVLLLVKNVREATEKIEEYIKNCSVIAKLCTIKYFTESSLRLLPNDPSIHRSFVSRCVREIAGQSLVLRRSPRAYASISKRSGSACWTARENFLFWVDRTR